MLLRDGPAGTMLAPYLETGEVPLSLLSRAPARVRDMHAAWIEAGASRIHTATLQVLDLPDRRRRDTWQLALDVARDAAGEWTGGIDVAALAAPPSVGAGVARSWYQDLEWLLDAGVTSVTCACVTGADAAGAFTQAWQEVAVASGVPGLDASLSLTISPSRGREACAWVRDVAPAESMAVGLGCCEGPSGLGDWLGWLSERHESVFVAPSAGLPVRTVDGTLLWPVEVEAWSVQVADLATTHGADAVGACCGCTPGHLAALAAALDR